MINKTSQNKSVRYRNRQKKKAVEYLGGKCVRCGYSKCLAALHFHHTDPSNKLWAPSRVMSYRWEVVKEELHKCILICANCHAEEHEGITEYNLLKAPNGEKTLYSIVCAHCNVAFETSKKTRKFCTDLCAKTSKRKVKRPSKEELSELVKISTIEHIARLYGVTGNSVRKWISSYESTNTKKNSVSRR